VVDARFASTNNGKVLALARVDILFMEAAFMQTNAVVAAKRGHLTADQAGTLAREAGAKRLVRLHHSPRYHGRGEELAREAEVAFRGG
jgi:ribonuclease Z